MRSQSLLSLIAAATCASSKPLFRRDVVDHDSIDPFPETVSDDTVGDNMLKFEPYLDISNGCQPYPAVDAEGNTSGGLDNTGGETEGCEDEAKGQTYVRGAQYEDRYALMYAWYMPKDQPLDNMPIGSHRHDWENVVIWIDNGESANASLVGAVASAHGEYKRETDPATTNDTHVLIEYFSEFPTNHELGFTDTVGRDMPLIDWDSLPQASRDALEDTDFGDATVPFKEDQFMSKLEDAYNLEE